ncbi:MAG: HAMP domain-containing protein [Proteobacteria bacterium]|nr:HAMP domain-containing protein [Pseudomonadota bacterium]MBU1739219.1 HAMP domain-containing protein [Pseudomonadota bacterium]
MHSSKLIWQLFPAYILIIVGTMLSIAWYGSVSLRDFYLGQMAANLEAQSRLLEPRISHLYSSRNYPELAAFTRDSGRNAQTRITVIAAEGKVVSDTSREPRAMDNHGQRPEILQAMAGVTGISQRYSASTNQEMLYVAIPMRMAGNIVGVIRTSIPLTTVRESLNDFFLKIGFWIIVVTVITSCIAFLASQKITRPLEAMTSAAARFAAGDLTGRIEVSGSEEIVSLARAMNRMATLLRERIEKVETQHNELETVVSSMIEGVIACDLEARVLYMNHSAAVQLEVNQLELQGGNILEVVRNIDLVRFIRQTLNEDEPVEGTVFLNRGREDEKILQVHGAQLTDPAEKRIGALIVINDVTRLLKLENLRRDFVANVSHELKTPITSIKGYVETLLQECDAGQPHFRDFLLIIAKHANRLQTIVEDLLTLSRIEQEGRRDQIELKPAGILACVESAAEVCSAKAADRNIEINLHGLSDLRAMVNAPLLEQALINLIDNAVKYSPEHSTVHLDSGREGNYVAIHIRDNGPGIESRHLTRLFERFYLVDKARSRKLGGTGLGLAIVKHIVEAHKGQVTVHSELGRGSVFTVRLQSA